MVRVLDVHVLDRSANKRANLERNPTRECAYLAKPAGGRQMRVRAREGFFFCSYAHSSSSLCDDEKMCRTAKETW